VVTGIQVILSGIQMPRMNSIMERWIQTCRHELLDRTLIWNQRHLLHALREYEQFYNSHRPHQGIANTRPLGPPTTDHQSQPTMPPEPHGRHFGNCTVPAPQPSDRLYRAPEADPPNVTRHLSHSR
jgi:transposase InsO family protein